MTFNTSGELRTEEREDGWYVLGKGMLIPVKDEDEGQRFIVKFTLINKNNNHEKNNRIGLSSAVHL